MSPRRDVRALAERVLRLEAEAILGVIPTLDERFERAGELLHTCSGRVSVTEEACPMNLAPTSSTTAALAMGDALAMVLLDLRGLRPEDYAALHPRGTLGWRALFRVGDLMHTGDAMPVVLESAPLAEAVQ